MSTALPEMLTAELAAGGKLRTFPGENIARASADLGLTGMQTLARDTLGHLRKYLGSDYVVLGSYLDQGSAAEAGSNRSLVAGHEDRRDCCDGFGKGKRKRPGRSGNSSRRQSSGKSLGSGEVTPSEAALVRASLPSESRSGALVFGRLGKTSRSGRTGGPRSAGACRSCRSQLRSRTLRAGGGLGRNGL